MQYRRNAAQLVPVVRADTAGFHGRREGGGRGVLLPSHIWPRGCAIACSSDKWISGEITERCTWQLPEQTKVFDQACVTAVNTTGMCCIVSIMIHPQIIYVFVLPASKYLLKKVYLIFRLPGRTSACSGCAPDVHCLYALFTLMEVWPEQMKGVM